MPKSNRYINANGEQIDFTVHVYTRPNLRDEVGEMMMFRGRDILEIMFDRNKVNETITRFDMEYPERWANILELRAIPDRMLVCFPNLKDAYIKTHSVYLIQCVHHEHIGICDKASDYPDGVYTDLGAKFCKSPDKFEGLWTMNPTDGFKKID